MTANGKPRVLVLGGGFSGLETAFALRAKVGPRAHITLVSDRPEFLFKPNTIYIPFGTDPDSLLIPLARPSVKRDLTLVVDRVEGLEPEAGRVVLGLRPLDYDFLVIGTGAGMRPGEVPGLAEHAETIWTPAEMLALRERLTALLDRARRGEQQTVLFAVPPGNKCSGPLYEIVFMLETWLRRKGVRDHVRLEYTTYERSFIQAFGPKLHEVVIDEFASREIFGRTDVRLVEVEPGTAVYEGGERRPFDLLIAFPPYVAAIDYDALPRDERGFLRTEPVSRRVEGQERIFGPGDAGDFPVKQAFLAFLQANAVAEAIAAEVDAREPAFGFDPVSMCVMEEFNTATFAQVPLEVTGDPDAPVAVRPDADGAYRVGVSPLWRVGKKVLGLYVPLRFRAGRPFHEGAGWAAMDTALKGMSAVLARR